jgi:hypothetical protein
MRFFFLLIELANVVTIDLLHDADPTRTVGLVNAGRWMGLSVLAFFDH